ncbi:Harbinger transposase-derived nuclease domain, partial [Dillenia turbinata]
MTGNETRCYQAFRMTRIVFIDFCLDLQYNYGLNPIRGMSIYEEVIIFLMTCAHGVSNRLIQEIFYHSGETVHRHFHQVLGVINKLAKDIIKPHPHYNDGVGYHMPQNKKYLHFFKNYIGAIDGTRIKARLSRGEEILYIGRKGYPTQNVLAIVDFNTCFTFVWAGCEGVAHDNRIFGEALRNQNLNFPYPLGHKENIRYHLEDFHHARTRQLRQSRGVKKKFNFPHSSCRNIIERTFGVWKVHFLILGDMPYYPINVQTEIVLATMAIHNYIRQRSVADNRFEIAQNETYLPSNTTSIPCDTNMEVENEDDDWTA